MGMASPDNSSDAMPYFYKYIQASINFANGKVLLISQKIGLNAGKYGPEKTPYLDTFYTVFFLRIAQRLVSVVLLEVKQLMTAEITDANIREFLPMVCDMSFA